MTMLSFRVDETEAAALRRLADQLGVARSELLRAALRRHLVRLQAEAEVAAWATTPLTPEERSLADAAEWGPAEDWSDWDDAKG